MNQKTTRDALIICITQYADLKMSAEMTALAQHAEEIAKVLETKGGFRVKRLPVTKLDNDKEFIDPEQMVMANELKLAIEQLLIPKSGTPPTTALIYFAGHGLQKEINADRYEGFLATSYANPKADEWGVSLQWLRQLLEQSPVQQQIVWIDACYSGELFNFTVHDSVHEKCFISSARAHEDAYAEGELTKALLETLDYTKQLNPWVDHLTLTEGLKIENKKAVGSQRFVFDNTDKPIILTNKAFDLDVDYKNVCPFKGLESFDSEKNPDDAFYFKGRTQLTNELLEKVQSANFLAVLGASGNGKSSVVRAGLLYSIRQTQRWQILPVITPTAQPLKALGTVISMPAEQLTDFINQAQTKRQVLVIDQFEEIFTLCKNDTEREQFFAILLAAIERADNKFCLIIVMRADFLDKCSHHVDLAKQIQAHQVIVTPMTPAELEEAIVAPTQQVGLQIEPKLVSEMLADVKGALGSLPLLQYTLTELWKKCATQRLLTFSAYEELGKIAGTLEQGANGVYQKLSPAEQKTAQRIFIELTQLGEGTPDTRRQLSQQDLVTSLPFESAPVSEVIQKLVDANLVVTDKPKEEQVAVVNIAHEALTQHWRQLRNWLDENREAIKIQRNIEADAKKWQNSNKSKNALLQGLDLNIAKNYAKTHTEKVPLSALAQNFVKRSVKRQHHYWMGVIGSVVGVMLVLAGIAYYANEQRIEAEEQRQFAQEQQKLADEQRIEADNQREFAQTQQKLAEDESQRAKQERDNALRSQSLFLADLAKQETEKGNAGNGILLALEALPKNMSAPDRPYIVEAEQQLYKAVMNLRERLSLEHEFKVSDVAFSPDGQRIVTTSTFRSFNTGGNSAYLWDTNSGKQLSVLRHEDQEDVIENAIFSSDGQYVLTTSANNAYLWKVKTGKQFAVLKKIENTVDLLFSPDGRYVMLETSYVEDMKTGKKIVFTKHNTGFDYTGIAYSPDGQTIAKTSDKDVRLLDINTGKQSFVLIGHSAKHHAVFDPDGKRLVTTKDRTVQLWNVKTGKPLLTLELENFVNNAAFDPINGQYVIVACSDNTARLWNTETNTQKILVGHKDAVEYAIFSPDRQYVLTISRNHTARLWNFYSGEQVAVLVAVSGDEIGGFDHATFSPDGKYIATTFDDTVHIWHVKKTLVTSIGEYDEIDEFFVSPNGQQIITIDSNFVQSKVAYLWNINTGKQLAVLKGHKDTINHVTFSPNGQHIVTVSGYGNEHIDNTARLWDSSTGKQVMVLKGHESPVNYAAFSPDGQKIVTVSGNQVSSMKNLPTDTEIPFISGDNTIRFWETNTGKPLAVITGHENAIYYVAFSPNGQHFITLSYDNTVRLWNAKTGKQIAILAREYTGTFSGIDEVIFSPNGQNVLITSNMEMKLWNINTNNYRQLLAVAASRGINHATFSPNGEHIIAAYGNTVVVLSTGTGEQVLTFTGEPIYQGVNHAIFSPNGQRIITTSRDKTTRIWDASTGKQLAVLQHESDVDFAVFTRDGQYIITKSIIGGDVIIWRVFSTTQDLIDYARTVVPRQLTLEQRKKFSLPETETKTQILVRKVKKLLDDGKELAQKGNINAAIDKFQKALKLDPSLTISEEKLKLDSSWTNFHPETKARQIAAQTLINEGVSAISAAVDNALDDNIKYSKVIIAAETKFKKALALDPTLNFNSTEKVKQVIGGKFYYKLEDAVESGNSEAVVEIYQKVLKFDYLLPHYDSLQTYLAKAKKNQNAAQALKRKTENAKGLVNKGKEFAKKGDINKAVEQFQKALKLDPRLEFDPNKKSPTTCGRNSFCQGRRDDIAR
jgi:WD40 repeat protein/tetratricopeptide (TPR) repeat protein